MSARVNIWLLQHQIKNNKKNYRASNGDVPLVVAEPIVTLVPRPILYHHGLGDKSNMSTTHFGHMYGETADRTEKQRLFSLHISSLVRSGKYFIKNALHSTTLGTTRHLRDSKLGSLLLLNSWLSKIRTWANFCLLWSHTSLSAYAISYLFG